MSQIILDTFTIHMINQFLFFSFLPMIFWKYAQDIKETQCISKETQLNENSNLNLIGHKYWGLLLENLSNMSLISRESAVSNNVKK